jgi:pimeloyl-ACP methyl ester carboxylesterase
MRGLLKYQFQEDFMRPRTLAACFVLMLSAAVIAVAQGNTEVKTGYAAVHGLKMYYRIQGSGRPLVLLHGALSNIDTDFGKLLPELTKTRLVIAIEQQAHGHTADIDRPITYVQMADDTVELLRQLKIENADFFGYSMGGGVAFELAMRHPEMVKKLVWAGGTSYSPEGLYPIIRSGAKDLKPELLIGSPWQKAYAGMAPEPAKWSVLVFKIRDLDTHFVGWNPAEVRAIQAPALLIVGDSDIVRPEHVVEMFHLLGGGVPGDVNGLPRSQLAVLPGTTHVSVIERAGWLLSMVTAFLDAPPPKAN